MIKSMTGFGFAYIELPHSKVSVEIRALNSKFLDLSLRLPKTHFDKENLIRNTCSRLIERGKGIISITIEDNACLVEKQAHINAGLLQSYYHSLKLNAAHLQADVGNLFQLALQMPNVIQDNNDQDIDADVWQHILSCTEEALQRLDEFRSLEGTILKQDLLLRIANIKTLLLKIEVEEPKRIPLVKARINKYLEETSKIEHIDSNRFEQELIYYIEKFDITEEKVRLNSHCDYFISTLNNEKGSGKKLGFISQELGREINTLGAKANDATIQRLVVEMKDELEKIKEQLLNVL